jgi:hypothetical protein
MLVLFRICQASRKSFKSPIHPPPLGDIRVLSELHWAIHAWRLMDRVIFGRAHPCFYLTVWFQRECFEALQAVNTMEHAFSFHGASGECQWMRDLWTSNGAFYLCGDEELTRCSISWSNSMQVEATAQEKSTVLSFRMKIQGLALIDCTWQLSCCRHCFESEDFLQGENLRSMIGRR